MVEGSATFERDGDKLTWDANGKDVYYQGDSEEELPLTLQITYLGGRRGSSRRRHGRKERFCDHPLLLYTR